MRYLVRHTTDLAYDGIVRLARLNLRLRPAPCPPGAGTGQQVHAFRLDVTPPPAQVEEISGPWICHRHRLNFRETLSRLRVAVTMEVEVAAPSFALDMAIAPSLPALRQAAMASADLSNLGPAAYLYASPLAPLSAPIADWSQALLAASGSQNVLSLAIALMAAIHSQFTYDDAATDVSTPAARAFAQKRGVCQDFAHIMIIAARALGIPAAYVSGYLRTLPPPGQPRLVGADAMHAWAGLWCGEALGWIGFDPTNNCLAGTDHIFTAMGRDYADIAPIDGVFLGGAGQRLATSVDVEPLA